MENESNGNLLGLLSQGNLQMALCDVGEYFMAVYYAEKITGDPVLRPTKF
jgi:hypothetical protein